MDIIPETKGVPKKNYVTRFKASGTIYSMYIYLTFFKNCNRNRYSKRTPFMYQNLPIINEKKKSTYLGFTAQAGFQSSGTLRTRLVTAHGKFQITEVCIQEVKKKKLYSTL